MERRTARLGSASTWGSWPQLGFSLGWKRMCTQVRTQFSANRSAAWSCASAPWRTTQTEYRFVISFHSAQELSHSFHSSLYVTTKKSAVCCVSCICCVDFVHELLKSMNTRGLPRASEISVKTTTSQSRVQQQFMKPGTDLILLERKVEQAWICCR